MGKCYTSAVRWYQIQLCTFQGILCQGGWVTHVWTLLPALLSYSIYTFVLPNVVSRGTLVHHLMFRHNLFRPPVHF